MSDIQQIENLLRKTPPLTPPSGLREKLQRQISIGTRQNPTATAGNGKSTNFHWPLAFKRWLPALSFSALFLACLVAIAVQSNLLSELSRENDRLRRSNQEVEQPPKATIEQQTTPAGNDNSESLSANNPELRRLREEVNRLRAELQDLQPLRAENQRLRAEIKAAESQLPPNAQREEDPFQAARDKAQKVACINNIKQIGLAARLWASDNNDVLPMDFASMSNELNTTKILVCPGDTNRSPAINWQEMTQANVTYELLSRGASERDPTVVLVRCPIHNNVGLTDGSAHMLNQDRRVVQKDGKWVIGRGN